MKDILHYLPVLLVSIGMNILLGLYYKIGVNKLGFDLKILINGLIKAGIIGLVFIGMAFCFDRVDLSSLGVNPCIFMHSAIFLYMGKALSNLGKILGVQVKKQADGTGSAGTVLADAAATAASTLTAPLLSPPEKAGADTEKGAAPLDSQTKTPPAEENSPEIPPVDHTTEALQDSSSED